MTLALQRLVLAIVLTTIVAFSAGLEAGRALATQPPSNAAPAPAVTNGTSSADYSDIPRLCTFSLGTEDYESCQAYFGDQYPRVTP
jgi:hypothetical protein